MKKFLQITGIFVLMILMSFSFADFYSSMTKVDYVEGSKTLKFTTKMNTQHISDAIKINTITFINIWIEMLLKRELNIQAN